MTWYVKYRVEFTDDLGVDWKVHIKKQAASAFTITDYQGTGQPLIFEWYGDDDPFRQRIQGSKANISIWCPNDFELLELFSADIQEYQVIIYQNSTLFWKGYVLPGEYQEAYDQPPLNVNIGASDGLGLLKEFQFKDLDYGFTRQRFSKVIYDILGLIEWTQFKEFINLYSSNMSSGTEDSPLDQVGLDPQLFKTATCYDALEAILKMFNAGIKQDIGEMIIYRFIEIQASMHGRKFTSAAAKTYVAKNPDQFISRTAQPSHIRDVEGGALTMIPQASKHIINYDFGLKESILRNWEFHFDDFTLAHGVYNISPWTGFNVLMKPLSKEIVGEEKGVILSVFDQNYTPFAAYIEQVVEGLKARPHKFRLTFEYMFLNSDKENPKTNRFFNCRLRNIGTETRYWDAQAGGWTHAVVGSRVFQGDIPPGNSDWYKADFVVGDSSGIPYDGSLELRLFPVTVEFASALFDVRIAYRNVQIVMTPAEGDSDVGIGYTYPSSTKGRVIEHEHILGDGFTSARHAVNQLLSYSGIINMYDNGNILDPFISEGTIWSTRDMFELQTIYEIVNAEMGREYTRARHVIDLPVWVDDGGTFISGVGNLQDVLNKSGGNNRKFHVGVRSFNAKTRDYQLILTEFITGAVPPGTDWANDMVISYLALNPEQALWMPSALRAELLSRLGEGKYLHTTFGPDGQNKTTCDFLYLLQTTGNLTARTNAKTGDALRWDIDGTVTTQNNLPAHTLGEGAGIITVSSTDGWSGLTEFRYNSNNMTGRPPKFDFANLEVFDISNNQHTGVPPLWVMPVVNEFLIYNNQFSGAAPPWYFPKIHSKEEFRINNNQFTSFEVLLAKLYTERANFDKVFTNAPGLRFSSEAEAEPLPVGKSPAQAYADGNTGTGKWYMHVLMEDPDTEGFRVWDFHPDYAAATEYTITFNVDDGVDPIEGVNIEITPL